MAKMLGIDLGTAYTRFCLKNDGIIMRSPSVISIKNKTREILAVGTDAKRMIGRNPSSISVIKPIRGGIVSNVEHASMMVSAFLEETEQASTFRRPTVIASLPFGSNESERRALEDAFLEAGASEVLLADQPLAAALGAGMKVMSARGGMLVDVGAGTIEVAVISHGGVIISSVLKTAGEAMTDAVIRCVMENHSILIGEMTAEWLKVKLGTVSPSDRGYTPISGKSTKMGGAAQATVASGELREALTPFADTIVKTIRSALEAMPPELSSDIADYGILLCGGGSLLPGLPEYIKNALGMNVALAKEPTFCVAAGLHRIMNSGNEMPRFICSSSK